MRLTWDHGDRVRLRDRPQIFPEQCSCGSCSDTSQLVRYDWGYDIYIPLVACLIGLGCSGGCVHDG